MTLTQPHTCGLHQRTLENGRTYFLTEADGQTPASEALLQRPVAVHLPCDEDSHHLLELRGDAFTIDTDAKPWPATPQQQAVHVARIPAAT